MKAVELTGLMPLEPPPPPAADPWPLAGALLLLLILAALAAAWWRQPHRRRLRRLRRLPREYTDSRHLADRLDKLLREHLGREVLLAHQVPDTIGAAQWGRLLGTLDAARFSTAGMDRASLIGLLPQVHAILGKRHD